MSPKVSIVMPIYNVSRYLDQALESAKRQTLKDIEIVCVNDGSTDNSLDIIKKWAEGDDRFVIIDKENEGYGVGMNIGIGKATGEYVAILEPDDFVPLNMYEDLYEIAKANDLDIVKGDFYRFTVGETGNMALRYIALDKSNKYYHQVLNPAETPELLGLVSYTWTGLYRRAFLEEKGIDHHTTPGASFQDIGFFWKTTSQASRVMLIDKPYYRYRSDNPNQSVRNHDKVYFRDQEFDYIKDFLMNTKDPDLWARYSKYYYVSRFRRGLVNLKRIHDTYAEEYIEFMRGYYPAVVESGEFDLDMLSKNDRDAYELMMNDPDAFSAKYHTRRAASESANNTDIWEVLKREKKKNKELRDEIKQLNKKIDAIKESKSYKAARMAGKFMHPGKKD